MQGLPGEPYIALAQRAPGARGGLRVRAGRGLRARSGRDSRDRPRRSDGPSSRLRGSSRRELSLPGSRSTPSVGSAIAFSSRRSQRARRRCYAFDCRGRARALAAGAPHVEGGIARGAPHLRPLRGHADRCLRGNRAGSDAFGPGGRVRLVAESGLPAGGDIGVESVGFVPPKLGRRGAAYLADMGAPGSPTSGSDSLLILAGTKPVSRQPSRRRAGRRDRGRREDNRRPLRAAMHDPSRGRRACSRPCRGTHHVCPTPLAALAALTSSGIAALSRLERHRHDGGGRDGRRSFPGSSRTIRARHGRASAVQELGGCQVRPHLPVTGE